MVVILWHEKFSSKKISKIYINLQRTLLWWVWLNRLSRNWLNKLEQYQFRKHKREILMMHGCHFDTKHLDTKEWWTYTHGKSVLTAPICHKKRHICTFYKSFSCFLYFGWFNFVSRLNKTVKQIIAFGMFCICHFYTPFFAWHHALFLL